jgi:hypothetical protein
MCHPPPCPAGIGGYTGRSHAALSDGPSAGRDGAHGGAGPAAAPNCKVPGGLASPCGSRPGSGSAAGPLAGGARAAAGSAGGPQRQCSDQAARFEAAGIGTGDWLSGRCNASLPRTVRWPQLPRALSSRLSFKAAFYRKRPLPMCVAQCAAHWQHRHCPPACRSSKVPEAIVLVRATQSS